MKIAIMQPYFFPYIGYFQLISAVDKFVIYDDVNFIKRGWVNRNRILINKEAKLISLSLIKASQNKLINEIIIKDKGTILKTIKQNYSKTAYFKDVFPIIEDIVNYSENNLSRYLFYQIKKITEYLQINTTLVPTSTIYEVNKLKGQNRIIEICRKENMDTYINAIGGKELYDLGTFQDNGFNLKFIQMENIEYNQNNNKFIPNLSIIDVLMFNSKEEIARLLKQYSLKE